MIQRALQGFLPVQVWRLHQHRGRRGGAARGEDTWLGPGGTGGPGEVLEGRQHLGAPMGGAGHLQDQERSVGAGLHLKIFFFAREQRGQDRGVCAGGLA